MPSDRDREAAARMVTNLVFARTESERVQMLAVYRAQARAEGAGEFRSAMIPMVLTMEIEYEDYDADVDKTANALLDRIDEAIRARGADA